MDDGLVASRNHMEHQEFVVCFRVWRSMGLSSKGEVHLQRLTGGLPGPRGGCHWRVAAPGTCGGHLRLPTAVYKRKAAEVPEYDELLPPFHLQSRLYPQAADRRHTWTQWMQHAGRVDPAAEFCKQAKSTLSDVAAWAHPLQGAQLSLAVDASDHHVGGVWLAASGGGSA